MPDADFHDDLAAARQGERAALDRLFGEFYPTVQANVHRHLASDFRAKRPWIGAMFSTGDVVQEVFLCVLRCLDDFEGRTPAEFVGYLTTLTRNRIVDAVRFHEAVRRDRRRTESEADEPIDARGGAPEQLLSQEQARRYAEAVATLRERERALLRSRLEAGDKPPPFEQLAGELGYPSAGAARQAFYKSKAQLLVRLAPDVHP